VLSKVGFIVIRIYWDWYNLLVDGGIEPLLPF